MLKCIGLCWVLVVFLFRADVFDVRCYIVYYITIIILYYIIHILLLYIIIL